MHCETKKAVAVVITTVEMIRHLQGKEGEM
jgi:hypothetical protein